MNYADACNAAATDQGLDPIVAELRSAWCETPRGYVKVDRPQD